jgi:hypothetical protein
MRGSGYHDRNGSDLPLDGLGMSHWTWGRQVIGNKLLVYYLTWPATPDVAPLFLGFEIDSSGHVTRSELTVELEQARFGRFGMPWWRRIHMHGMRHPLTIEVAPPADDGPFYLRATTTAHYGGQRANGWTELCRPVRVDRTAMRPLVSMCVQHESQGNSMWLPLFVGPPHDRFARLLNWWRR